MKERRKPEYPEKTRRFRSAAKAGMEPRSAALEADA